MGTDRIVGPESLDTKAAAAAYQAAWRDRLEGRAADACAAWEDLERRAVAADMPQLAAQFAAERAVTLTYTGRLALAAEACDQAFRHLAVADDERPPAEARRIVRRAGARWLGRGSLHRLRAEHARRAGHYRDAHAELAWATEVSGPEGSEAWGWGREIMSQTVRLAGDFDGGLDIAVLAREALADGPSTPHVRATAALLDRAAALALLAQDLVDEARVTFAWLSTQPEHQHVSGQIACDLGLGEAARRREDLRSARHHLQRALASASMHGRPVQWVQAQLCLAETLRAADGDHEHVARMVEQALACPVTAEHPFLQLRALTIAAVVDPDGGDDMLDEAERQLTRFRRRSCDAELDVVLIERCRAALDAGRQPEPIPMDFF